MYYRKAFAYTTTTHIILVSILESSSCCLLLFLVSSFRDSKTRAARVFSFSSPLLSPFSCFSRKKTKKKRKRERERERERHKKEADHHCRDPGDCA